MDDIMKSVNGMIGEVYALQEYFQNQRNLTAAQAAVVMYTTLDTLAAALTDVANVDKAMETAAILKLLGTGHSDRIREHMGPFWDDLHIYDKEEMH